MDQAFILSKGYPMNPKAFLIPSTQETRSWFFSPWSRIHAF